MNRSQSLKASNYQDKAKAPLDTKNSPSDDLSIPIRAGLRY